MNARPVSWLQPTVCTADRSAASQPATTCSLIRCTRLRLISGSTGCCSCAGVSSKRRRHLMEKKNPSTASLPTSNCLHKHVRTQTHKKGSSRSLGDGHLLPPRGQPPVKVRPRESHRQRRHRRHRRHRLPSCFECS